MVDLEKEQRFYPLLEFIYILNSSKMVTYDLEAPRKVTKKYRNRKKVQ